jgi:hypothetical protein
MNIYWKNQAAYDENGNFLAIIHQLPNTQFYGFLNYPTEEIDFRQYKIKTDTLGKAMQEIEAVFKVINDISEIEKVLTTSFGDADLPTQFLTLFAEFSIHHP